MTEINVAALSDVDVDEAIREAEIRRTGERKGRFGLAVELLAEARVANSPRLREIEDWVGKTPAWRESYPDATDPPPLPPSFFG